MKAGRIAVWIASLCLAFSAGIVFDRNRSHSLTTRKTQTSALPAVKSGCPYIVARYPLQWKCESPDVIIDLGNKVYKGPEQVSAELSNVGAADIHFQPILVSYPVVLRYLEGHDVWERLETMTCANAGRGQPRTLRPGEKWHLAMPWKDFVESRNGRVVVRTEFDELRPLEGTYRLVMPYARDSWNLFDSPSQTYLVMSKSFEIGG